jgi:hypothetical protein
MFTLQTTVKINTSGHYVAGCCLVIPVMEVKSNGCEARNRWITRCIRSCCKYLTSSSIEYKTSTGILLSITVSLLFMHNKQPKFFVTRAPFWYRVHTVFGFWNYGVPKNPSLRDPKSLSPTNATLSDIAYYLLLYCRNPLSFKILATYHPSSFILFAFSQFFQKSTRRITTTRCEAHREGMSPLRHHYKAIITTTTTSSSHHSSKTNENYYHYW